jgi:PAS domain S-box-containing protein
VLGAASRFPARRRMGQVRAALPHRRELGLLIFVRATIRSNGTEAPLTCSVQNHRSDGCRRAERLVKISAASTNNYQSLVGHREAADWFFENCVDLLVVVEQNIITRINPAWTDLTGWSTEETVGRPFQDFVHPDDDVAIADIAQQLATTGVGLGEHRALHMSGAWRWVRSRSKRARDGGVMVVLQDITELHVQAIELEDVRKSSELLRQAAGLFIYCYDPDRLSYVFDPDLTRPRDAQHANTSAVAADTVHRQIHRGDVAHVSAAWERVIATGGLEIIEYREFHPDRSVTRKRSAWRGLGKVASGAWEVLGITQDVTELADARDAALRGEEAARASADTQSQFLANMSHEIRTPMNGVLGVLHLLKNEPLSDGGRKLLAEALACGSMLAALLNDVIDFSKIEAGQLGLAPEPLNVLDVLSGVTEMLRPQAEGKNLRLTVTVDPCVGWVSADPVRLRQMLFNLIGNAVKFTLTGGVDVRVMAKGVGVGRCLRVEVEDTGIGIPLEVQDSLFQRFHQADRSTTRRFGGSGLGLAISRKLAELMGGEIGLISEEGCGSTFWFEIDAPSAQAPAETDVPDVGFLQDLRVLVVEDNPTNRMIATKMLESLGAVVETANDGAQAIEAARRNRHDIIFMDIQMPVMDGVAATRAIRSLGGPASLTPIIAMTANAMAHQQQTYLEAGMNGSIAKPYSPTAMLTEIARIYSDNEVSAAATSAARPSRPRGRR